MKKSIKFVCGAAFFLLTMLYATSLCFADDGTMTLEGGLAWLLSGGGSGVITYLLIDKVKFLKKLEPDYKRYASIGIVVLLASAGWAFSVAMGYMPTPQAWRTGIETAFSVYFVAITTSLIIHGSTDLRQKRLNGS